MTITRSEYGPGLVTILAERVQHKSGKHQEGLAYLQADTVQQVFVILDVGELGGNLFAGGEEHAI